MKQPTRWLSLSAAAILAAGLLPAQERSIRLPRDPQLSPDATRIAFAFRGDVWLASADGGAATRLTTHPADDESPFWSPDQQSIAFVSSRNGSQQLFVVPAVGGSPRQVTEDTLPKTLFGFTPDGTELLVGIATDRGYHRTESMRLFAVDVAGQKPKRMLFDAGVMQAAMAPDQKQVLFVRGRPMWSRKGYTGSQAAQLWHADLTTTPPTLTRLDEDRPQFQNVAAQFPAWGPDSRTCYFVSDPDGTFDVFARTIGERDVRRVTNVARLDRSDDGIVFPSLSKDGRTMLARRRFDLVRIDTATGAVTPIELSMSGDDHEAGIERRTVTNASSVAFTPDGKQMAFVAGEDVWVMDRILKEPVRVTDTPHEETSLAFGDGGKRLFFVSDAGGEVDVWEATCDREDGVWWLADSFALRQVTDDPDVEADLVPSPNGDHIAFTKGANVFVMDDDGTDHRRVVEAWAPPQFAWSPDGRWLCYAAQDDDYNSDVWLVPLDGTRPPFNVSRHPDFDGDPSWSGDGKRIAFVSRRDGEEADVYYVNLTKEAEEQTTRDAQLEKALAAMQPNGKAKAQPAAGGKDKDAKEAVADKGAGKAKQDAVAIDFDGMLDRRHRIAIPDSREGSLIWSPDGKQLAFSATVRSESGFYAVEFPNPGQPKKLAANGLRQATWLREGNQIVGLDGGAPAALAGGTKLEKFAFTVRCVRDWAAVRQVSFDQAWRAMRDRFYDPSMNNRDWQAIRSKYRPVAAACLGRAEFSELMNMMLGELNASHMGHSGGSDPTPTVERRDSWVPRTYHLGLRFLPAAKGQPGRVVESVIPKSPCDLERSRVSAGETLLAIDGQRLTENTDIDALLTMPEARDVELTVAGKDGAERTVAVRPTTSVQRLLYDEWVEQNRARVAELSEGRLGYLHIQGMDMPSFRQLEEDLYAAGAGKDGLVIDVRFNGGGSTTDHVLTALTQPVHSITQSRGSGEGYPQDRKVYASWTKPIVLMCNEHSFSNAEILSHAVKQLGRGRLVGMRTAGGVISTGAQGLLDGSMVRMPTRGWYLVSTGEDMELNGCMPDIAMWNRPDGPDEQLAAAVKALTDDVAAAREKGRVDIVPAAAKRQREAKDASGSRR